MSCSLRLLDHGLERLEVSLDLVLLLRGDRAARARLGLADLAAEEDRHLDLVVPVVLHLVDLGTHSVTFNGKAKDTRKIFLAWELTAEADSKGNNFVVGEGYTWSLNQKATLRSIVEESLLEVMYDIPERSDIRKCIITEETIREGRAPLILTKSEIEKGVDETNYQAWLAQQGETA